jgi:hypothetical protein
MMFAQPLPRGQLFEVATLYPKLDGVAPGTDQSIAEHAIQLGIIIKRTIKFYGPQQKVHYHAE